MSRGTAPAAPLAADLLLELEDGLLQPASSSGFSSRRTTEDPVDGPVHGTTRPARAPACPSREASPRAGPRAATPAGQVHACGREERLAEEDLRLPAPRPRGSTVGQLARIAASSGRSGWPVSRTRSPGRRCPCLRAPPDARQQLGSSPAPASSTPPVRAEGGREGSLLQAETAALGHVPSRSAKRYETAASGRESPRPAPTGPSARRDALPLAPERPRT